MLLARLVVVVLGTVAAGNVMAAVDIRIVYDNTSANDGLTADWGFSAVITTGAERILFDAGQDPALFLRNLSLLSIDPASITHAIISHHHADHRQGLFRLASRNRRMKAYFLQSFPRDLFEVAAAVGLRPIQVTGPLEIAPGIHTTGPIDGSPPEQALLVETGQGAIMIVGSGHPGVARMVEAAEEQLGLNSLRLLLGGFPLMRMRDEEILREIGRLKALGVRQVAPAHSTGERAKRLFRQAFGTNYRPAGAGRVLVLE